MPSKSDRVSRKSSNLMPKLSKNSCKILTLVLSAVLVLAVLFLLNKYVLKINMTEQFTDHNEFAKRVREATHLKQKHVKN